ncbi:PAS domain-containing protein [uncultured Parasphingorhabdus sp.]|uniref:PAS domain-containing protein n=1 Tax=uncultured Parasphingorhabdus sp. TaxID=2709694 RepID=UPI0030DAC613|tara:strand:- start:3 stop:854 length:852 start_codon:yes stop_codon:yes gene_type:complete
MNSELLDTFAQYESGIAEIASESIVVLDEAGIIRYWNPVAERLFGWPALAVRGRNVVELSLSPADEKRFWSQMLQEGSWQGRICRQTRDGKVINVDARRYLWRGAAGQPSHIVEFSGQADAGDVLASGVGPFPDHSMAASWEIDISSATSILEKIAASSSFAEKAELDDLYNSLVEMARIVEVNERTARLVGGNRGKALMVGQSVAACWPVGSRTILAELIVEALASSDGKTCCRQLASDGILRDPLVTVWSGERRRQGHLFIAVSGAADVSESCRPPCALCH